LLYTASTPPRGHGVSHFRDHRAGPSCTVFIPKNRRGMLFLCDADGRVLFIFRFSSSAVAAQRTFSSSESPFGYSDRFLSPFFFFGTSRGWFPALASGSLLGFGTIRPGAPYTDRSRTPRFSAIGCPPSSFLFFLEAAILLREPFSRLRRRFSPPSSLPFSCFSGVVSILPRSCPPTKSAKFHASSCVTFFLI